MTKTFKLALAVAMASPLAAMPLAQQALAATPQQVIGTADLEGAIANSNAKKTADSQRPTTYRPDLDKYQARGQALQSQINAMITKYQKDASVPSPNVAVLQQQEAAIKAVRDSGQQELNGILRPVAYSEAFVAEQIGGKLKQAMTNAMAKYKVTVLLAPQAFLLDQGVTDLTSAVTAELNTLIPNATLTPPAGWEPREVREARAAQAAQAQQQGQVVPAPAPAPAATTPRPSTQPVPRN